MKISEFIIRLHQLQQEHGDLNVITSGGYDDDTDWGSLYPADPVLSTKSKWSKTRADLTDVPDETFLIV